VCGGIKSATAAQRAAQKVEELGGEHVFVIFQQFSLDACC